MAVWICRGDSTALPLRDQSVGGIITSPPYGIGKAYPNDNPETYADHVAFLRTAWQEHRRVARGPVCWVLPLMLRGHFLYADVGEWAFCTPVVAGSEALVSQFGRGFTRAYVGVELLVCSSRPTAGVWIVFAPQPFIGHEHRNRPRHPAPFVKEIPLAAMRMFPEVDTWLDPFAGTGTSGLVARDLGKNCVLVELTQRWATTALREFDQLHLL